MIIRLPGRERSYQVDAGGNPLYIADYLISSADDIEDLPTSENVGIMPDKCACGSTAHFVDANGEIHQYELQNDNTWRLLA